MSTYVDHVAFSSQNVISSDRQALNTHPWLLDIGLLSFSPRSPPSDPVLSSNNRKVLCTETFVSLSQTAKCPGRSNSRLQGMVASPVSWSKGPTNSRFEDRHLTIFDHRICCLLDLRPLPYLSTIKGPEKATTHAAEARCMQSRWNSSDFWWSALLSSSGLSTEKASTFTPLLFQVFFHAVAVCPASGIHRFPIASKRSPGCIWRQGTPPVSKGSRDVCCALYCVLFSWAARQILFATARHWVVDCPSARAFESLVSTLGPKQLWH